MNIVQIQYIQFNISIICRIFILFYFKRERERKREREKERGCCIIFKKLLSYN